jgi:hypothetical protein
MKDIISRILGILRRLYGRVMKALAARGWKSGGVSAAAAQENKIKVREILTDASKWTQFADARDAEGKVCDVYSDRAVSFCLWGALERAYSENELVAATERIGEAIGTRAAGMVSVRAWNDDKRRTFEEVREVVEKAGV